MSTIKPLRQFLEETVEKHQDGDLKTPEGRKVIVDDLFEAIRVYGEEYTVEMFTRSAKAAAAAKGNGDPSKNL